MKYTINYFIKKFEAIPEEQWCTGSYEKAPNKHCTLGHCGARGEIVEGNQGFTIKFTEEAVALRNILRSSGKFGSRCSFDTIIAINDGAGVIRIMMGIVGATPKERILNALYKIRDNESKNRA